MFFVGGGHQFKYMQHSISKFYSATEQNCQSSRAGIILSTCLILKFLRHTLKLFWPWTCVNYKHSLKRENSLSYQTPYYEAVSSPLEKCDPFQNPSHAAPSGTGTDTSHDMHLACQSPRWEKTNAEKTAPADVASGYLGLFKGVVKGDRLLTTLAKYYLKIMFGWIYLSWGYIFFTFSLKCLLLCFLWEGNALFLSPDVRELWDTFTHKSIRMLDGVRILTVTAIKCFHRHCLPQAMAAWWGARQGSASHRGPQLPPKHTAEEQHGRDVLLLQTSRQMCLVIIWDVYIFEKVVVKGNVPLVLPRLHRASGWQRLGHRRSTLCHLVRPEWGPGQEGWEGWGLLPGRPASPELTSQAAGCLGSSSLKYWHFSQQPFSIRTSRCLWQWECIRVLPLGGFTVCLHPVITSCSHTRRCWAIGALRLNADDDWEEAALPDLKWFPPCVTREREPSRVHAGPQSTNTEPHSLFSVYTHLSHFPYAFKIKGEQRSKDTNPEIRFKNLRMYIETTVERWRAVFLQFFYRLENFQN